MESCTGLSIVTFISVVINSTLLIRYCIKKIQKPALNETMYHTGLFDGNASTSL